MSWGYSAETILSRRLENGRGNEIKEDLLGLWSNLPVLLFQSSAASGLRGESLLGSEVHGTGQL